MKVKNRFNGLDLINTVPEELWTEIHDTIKDAANKNILKCKKQKKMKWPSADTLKIDGKRSKTKGNTDRGKFAQQNT